MMDNSCHCLDRISAAFRDKGAMNDGLIVSGVYDNTNHRPYTDDVSNGYFLLCTAPRDFIQIV